MNDEPMVWARTRSDNTGNSEFAQIVGSSGIVYLTLIAGGQTGQTLGGAGGASFG